jgi:hypothetical protein
MSVAWGASPRFPFQSRGSGKSHRCSREATNDGSSQRFYALPTRGLRPGLLAWRPWRGSGKPLIESLTPSSRVRPRFRRLTFHAFLAQSVGAVLKTKGELGSFGTVWCFGGFVWGGAGRSAGGLGVSFPWRREPGGGPPRDWVRFGSHLLKTKDELGSFGEFWFPATA